MHKNYHKQHCDANRFAMLLPIIIFETFSSLLFPHQSLWQETGKKSTQMLVHISPLFPSICLEQGRELAIPRDEQTKIALNRRKKKKEGVCISCNF